MKQFLSLFSKIIGGEYDAKDIEQELTQAIGDTADGLDQFLEAIDTFNKDNPDSQIPDSFVQHIKSKYNHDLDTTVFAGPESEDDDSDDRTVVQSADGAGHDDITHIDGVGSEVDDVTQIAHSPNDDDKTQIASPDLDRTQVADHSISGSSTDSHAITQTTNDETILRGLNVSTKLDIGSVIKGRFRLEKLLGVGGMGKVFKAMDLIKEEAKNKQPYVALKLLTDDFKQHPNSFIILEREASKAQRLAHPNVSTVFDFDREESTGTIYMTMELLNGMELKEFIKKNVPKNKGISFKESWPLISGLADALGYAHKNNLIHSDFKPGNAFLTEHHITKQQIVKVIDFGIARAGTGSEEEGLGDANATAKDISKAPDQTSPIEEKQSESTLFDPATMNALTPAYASYEMHLGIKPDPSDDIYALGCVCYELLVGSHPYKKKTAVRALEKNIVPPSLEVTNLTLLQKKTLQKSVAILRKDRIKSIDEFLEGMRPRKNYSLGIITGSVLSVAMLLSITRSFYSTAFSERRTNSILASIYSGKEAQVERAIDTIINDPRTQAASRNSNTLLFDEKNCSVRSSEASQVENLNTASTSSFLNLDSVMGVKFDRNKVLNEARKPLLDYTAKKSKSFFDPIDLDQKSTGVLTPEDLLSHFEYRSAALAVERLNPIYPNATDVLDLRVNLCISKNNYNLVTFQDKLKDAISDKRFNSQSNKSNVVNGSKLGLGDLLQIALKISPDSESESVPLIIDEYDSHINSLLVKNKFNTAKQLSDFLSDQIPDNPDIQKIQYQTTFALVNKDDVDAVRSIPLQPILNALNNKTPIPNYDNNIERVYTPFQSQLSGVASQLSGSVSSYIATLSDTQKINFLRNHSALVSPRLMMRYTQEAIAAVNVSDATNTSASEAVLQNFDNEVLKSTSLVLSRPDYYLRFMRSYKAVLQQLTTREETENLKEMVSTALTNQFNSYLDNEQLEIAYFYPQLMSVLIGNDKKSLSMKNQYERAGTVIVAKRKEKDQLKSYQFARLKLDQLIAIRKFDDIENQYNRVLAIMPPSQQKSFDSSNYPDSIAQTYFTAAVTSYNQNNLEQAKFYKEKGLKYDPNNQDLTTLDQKIVLSTRSNIILSGMLKGEFSVEEANAHLSALSQFSQEREAFINRVVRTGITTMNSLNSSDSIDEAWLLKDTLLAFLPNRQEISDFTLLPRPPRSIFAYRGIIATEEGRLSVAQELLAKAQASEPNHKQTGKLAEALQVKFDRANQIFSQYESFLSVRDVGNASQALQAALAIWRDNEKYNKALENQSKYEQTISRGGRICFLSFAGFGKRNAICNDMVEIGDRFTPGPSLVVIPQTGQKKPFAIGKFEVSVAQYHQYCTSSQNCSVDVTKDPKLPIVGLGIEEINGYLRWLSEQSGFTYRLPALEEWQLAAGASGREENQDYNCLITRSGNVIKGFSILPTISGKSNRWGVVNYVGNADEIVSNGNQYDLMGGNFSDSYSICSIFLKKSLDANQSNTKQVVGFRVYRDLF